MHAVAGNYLKLAFTKPDKVKACTGGTRRKCLKGIKSKVPGVPAFTLK
jgi:hypothetical protein